MVEPLPIERSIELTNVKFVEFSCRQAGSPPWADFEDLEPQEARLTLKIAEDAEGNLDYHSRIYLKAPTDDACFRVEVVATFSWVEGAEPSAYTVKMRDEFLTERGTSVTFPYLREALTAASSRMGVATVLLPLLRDDTLVSPTVQEELPGEEA